MHSFASFWWPHPAQIALMAHLQTARVSGRQYQQFLAVLQADIASFRGLNVRSPAPACGGTYLCQTLHGMPRMQIVLWTCRRLQQRYLIDLPLFPFWIARE